MASLGEDLLGIVNKLQDLVFNTIGNDSLDLPQIVRHSSCDANMLLHVLTFDVGCRWIAIFWQVFSFRKHCRSGFSPTGERNSHKKTSHSTTYQHPERGRCARR